MPPKKEKPLTKKEKKRLEEQKRKEEEERLEKERLEREEKELKEAQERERKRKAEEDLFNAAERERLKIEEREGMPYENSLKNAIKKQMEKFKAEQDWKKYLAKPDSVFIDDNKKLEFELDKQLNHLRHALQDISRPLLIKKWRVSLSLNR